MSLALIEESAKEVRRLAIAGSPLAVGDFRLKKLVSPLEQAGAKAPVFGQVAKAISDLVNGAESESASRLLHLSTLLNAILYTQGQTGANGELRELEASSVSGSATKTSARTLRPLAEALAASGGGRLEVIKAGYERGAFGDFRLIDPSIRALGDGYPEIADFVAEKVLPGFGPGILSRLKGGFDPKGKKQEARRLMVMHRLDSGGVVELCKSVLDEGSSEVKVAAIACLGEHEEHLPLVLEQAGTKNKLLRAAALEALAKYDRPETTKLFTELIQAKTLDALAGPFRFLRNRQVLISLLAEGGRVCGLILKGDGEQIPRFVEVLNCLEARKEDEVEEFLLSCFSQSGKLGKVKAAKNSSYSGADLVASLVDAVYRIGSPKVLEALAARWEALPGSVFLTALRAALRVWSPDKVFTEFSPLLKQPAGENGERLECLERVMASAHWVEGSRFDPIASSEGAVEETTLLRKAVWDPRWLEAAIEADRQTVVYCFARADHKGCLEYLLKLRDAKKTSDAGLLVRALARCRYPEVTECFLNLASAKLKKAKYLDLDLEFLFENVRHLPASDLPKLDAFAATLDGRFADRLLEAMAPLRSPQSN